MYKYTGRNIRDEISDIHSLDWNKTRIINAEAPRPWCLGTKTLVPHQIWQGTLSSEKKAE